MPRGLVDWRDCIVFNIMKLVNVQLQCLKCVIYRRRTTRETREMTQGVILRGDRKNLMRLRFRTLHKDYNTPIALGSMN